MGGAYSGATPFDIPWSAGSAAENGYVYELILLFQLASTKLWTLVQVFQMLLMF